ncbi:hypothetical protein [Buttiauxella agrestis]|uniref:Lipoprotein n=1 Tax=Buttiauxella agrestis ATCC 33320 TaxID=1006004 RepID=A0A085G283_9ENTR|nr:hypothetical protein [Buttiauxella agrestis]KFC77828.1 hypothetical protein GBAG_3485 [Buttiauxella agrestis ATCC 33320]
MHGASFTHNPAWLTIKWLASFFMLAFFSMQSSASDSLPKGRDYPVEHIYSGKPAEHLDRSDEFTNMFRTRFKEAIQGDVVFAGEYARVGWGCGGSGCNTTAFINKRTGRALNHSFMVYYVGDDENPTPVGEEILYINKNSRLLVTYETDDTPDSSFYNYYALNKNALTLIRKVKDTNTKVP